MGNSDEDDRPVDINIDGDEFEDLPTTGIDVTYHVNFSMAGSFPLRLADVFFCEEGLYITEYGNITPLFGLATQRHKREAKVMQTIYEYHGIDEILLQADLVIWINYANVDRIQMHEGGRLGRPKISMSTTDGESYAYRIHGEISLQELSTTVGEIADSAGFSVDSGSGLGVGLKDSLWSSN